MLKNYISVLLPLLVVTATAVPSLPVLNKSTSQPRETSPRQDEKSQNEEEQLLQLKHQRQRKQRQQHLKELVENLKHLRDEIPQQYDNPVEPSPTQVWLSSHFLFYILYNEVEGCTRKKRYTLVTSRVSIKQFK